RRGTTLDFFGTVVPRNPRGDRARSCRRRRCSVRARARESARTEDDRTRKTRDAVRAHRAADRQCAAALDTRTGKIARARKTLGDEQAGNEGNSDGDAARRQTRDERAEEIRVEQERRRRQELGGEGARREGAARGGAARCARAIGAEPGRTEQRLLRAG